MEGFLKDLLTFCKDVIEIVDLYNGDRVEINHRLKSVISSSTTSSGDDRSVFKARCKVLISTPSQFLEVLKTPSKAALECNSLYVDKIDLHSALDLTNELVKISELMEKPTFKTILTTQFKGATSDNEQEQLLKKAFMGEEKALIIQLNDDQRVKSKCKFYYLSYNLFSRDP